jgi:predicted RND superfamily exporter protein
MVPNLVPVLCFFGLLGLGVAPLSLPTSLIGSVALGITIDDTVHTLVRYRSERRAGLSPDAAVLLTTRRVGRAIATTSLVLVAGFLVIALSGFATLREFGALSALTMTMCLACDLTLCRWPDRRVPRGSGRSRAQAATGHGTTRGNCADRMGALLRRRFAAVP